ncbi:pentapeptide repeat-containing protein [Nostoc sp. CALU 1950]
MANLRNSDLSDSDLGSANLNWVSLRGAKISRANLRDTKTT